MAAADSDPVFGGRGGGGGAIFARISQLQSGNNYAPGSFFKNILLYIFRFLWSSRYDR